MYGHLPGAIRTPAALTTTANQDAGISVHRGLPAFLVNIHLCLYAAVDECIDV